MSILAQEDQAPPPGMKALLAAIGMAQVCRPADPRVPPDPERAGDPSAPDLQLAGLATVLTRFAAAPDHVLALVADEIQELTERGSQQDYALRALKAARDPGLPELRPHELALLLGHELIYRLTAEQLEEMLLAACNAHGALGALLKRRGGIYR